MTDMAKVAHSMINYYKEQNDAQEKQMNELSKELDILRDRQRMLERAFQRLEDYANEQEIRADTYDNVVRTLLINATALTRDEIRDAIDTVAHLTGEDIDEVLDLPIARNLEEEFEQAWLEGQQ